MASLTSAGSLSASCPDRSPAFTALSFPALPPPPTRPLPTGLRVVTPHWSTPLRRSKLRQSLTGSSSWSCCIVFTFVAVVQVLSVALHPASRRRGYFKFSPAQRWPMARVFHPGGECAASQRTNGGLAAALFFASIGLFFAFFMGIPWVRRFLGSRHFPFTAGELVSAEVGYQSGSGGSAASGGGSGGYAVDIEFTYRVDGAVYRSRQFGSLPFFALKSRAQEVQAQIDRLKAEKDLRVYYDPSAPWDGFLNHVTIFGAATPLLMGVLFATVGFIMAWHQLSRGREALDIGCRDSSSAAPGGRPCVPRRGDVATAFVRNGSRVPARRARPRGRLR